MLRILEANDKSDSEQRDFSLCNFVVQLKCDRRAALGINTKHIVGQLHPALIQTQVLRIFSTTAL